MPSECTRVRITTSLPFLAGGLGIGGWAVNIPLIKEGLSLSEFELGSALLAFAVGAIVTMPLVGRATTRTGVRALLLASGLAFAATLATAALSWSLPVLTLWMAFMGIAFGTLDVAMNSQAAIVEAASGRPLMSSFHAVFSFGQLAGAGLSSVLLAISAGAAVTLFAVSIPIAAAALLGHSRPQGVPAPSPRQKGAASSRPWNSVVIAAGVLAFLSLFSEGVLLDWSAVFMVETLSAAEHASALVFCGFAGAMTIGRIFGDRVVRRFGHVATQQVSGLATLFGLALFVLSARLDVAAIGLVLCGLGLSNIIPILFAVAGQADAEAPGVGVARVAAIGYAGLLIGPPIIGFIAEAFSLTTAFGLVFSAMVVTTLGSHYLRADRRAAFPVRSRS